MGMRTDALWRVLALGWALVVGSIVVSGVALVGFLWMIVDVIWQFIVGSDGLSSSSLPAKAVNETLMWETDMLAFAFTGAGGGFDWFPSI